MQETVLVNFHCHTNFSDGDLSPEILAVNLSASGVRYAALTDHNTLEGFARFQEALKKSNISIITGIELTTQYHGRELHLLAYGFDPLHAELNATLISIRQKQPLEVHSVADSMRKVGSIRGNGQDFTEVISAAPNGELSLENAIQLIHRAGGKAFLAHPLYFESDINKLDRHLADMKDLGLDGLETIYAPFTDEEQEALRGLAEKHDLIISAGTDFHGNQLGSTSYSIAMPREDWQKFREAVISGQSKTAALSSLSDDPDSKKRPGKSRHFRKRAYVLRIFLPTLFAMALFLSAFWGFILPSFEQTLLDRKREMIRELTNSAWSILASYNRDAEAGLITKEQAQRQAIERIEALRYGDEGLDYFWIQDMEPRMIMHPYRVDLNGQPLNNFTDPRGVKIFVEFASLVQRDGEGYIDYVWQWKDDPERLEPKESYVKGFEPWEWIIGTGIYIDDVNQEIARLEQRIIRTALIIFAIIVLLLIFVLQQSLNIERQRQGVMDDLRDSTDRYHSLVESTNEGMLLIVDGRCKYANPIFLSMLGYTVSQLDFLDVDDVLPDEPDNTPLRVFLFSANPDKGFSGKPHEGCLMNRDGKMVDCILTVNPISVSNEQGYLLLARKIDFQMPNVETVKTTDLNMNLPIGMFRSRPIRDGVFLEINDVAVMYHERVASGEGTQAALADFFPEKTEFDHFLQKIQREGEIKDYVVYVDTINANAMVLSITARMIFDDFQHGIAIIGVIEDVTQKRNQEIAREKLINRLQSSLLFLQEPISTLGRDLLICKMDATVEQLSRLMTSRQVTAALVSSEAEVIIGIVTDHDLRARVLSQNISRQTPVHQIMSAPITRISENFLVYEALMLMEEKAVRHLAVEDQNGRIVSVIDSKSIIQFQRFAPVVLSREISRADSYDSVSELSNRRSTLAHSLMTASARPRYVTHMISSVCDAATQRIIELAVEELGEPPAPFTFIAMGSQGRQEQTLLTDQDNGIIYLKEDASDGNKEKEYFLALGSKVSDALVQAGYPYCNGKVMASNTVWCRSIKEWKKHFDVWVLKSEPQEIIDLSIFFDFRAVYGESDFSDELRQHIHKVLADKPGIFHHLAVNTLQYKPPLRLLGSFYLGGGTTEQSGEINLKDALMPIVSFARLYALRHKIPQTHTLDRIEALADRNLILPSSRDEMAATYEFLMEIRLEHQLQNMENGQSLSNIIHPRTLNSMQQEMLKQAFAQITAVQKKISYDFLGGM
jgi:PAS domain S-box-containing protein